MAADRDKRPRDERGRFVSKDAKREPKRSAAKAHASNDPGATDRPTSDRGAERERPSPAARNGAEVGSTSGPLAGDAGADLDAMGLDKRRGVVGGSYGPSIAKQVSVYGAFIAVVAALVIGSIIAINELDQPRDRDAAEAPWAQPDAEQLPPRPLDFPRSGQTEVN